MRAAFDLVNREGAAALTMPRLARDLDVGTMTLYGYAESKEALVEALLDLVLEDLSVPETGLPWPEIVEAVYLAAYRLLVRFRNATQLVAQSPAFGLAQSNIIEHVLTGMETQGIDPEAAFHLQRTAGTYTLGFALFTIAETIPGDRPRARWAASARFPRTSELADMLARPVDEEQFLIGLRTIIAGANAT